MNNPTFQIALDRFEQAFAGLESPIQNTIPAVKPLGLALGGGGAQGGGGGAGGGGFIKL